MEWYWTLIIATFVAILNYILGYIKGVNTIEVRYIQGELVIDEFEDLPYLALKGDLEALKNRECVILKVVRTKKDDSQKKQGL